MSAQFNKEKTGKTIVSILDRLRTVADPALLAEYRKIFKKEVSFFRRSWVAAWLLMAYEQNGGAGKRFGEKRAFAESAGEGQRCPPLPEAESRRLFISVGRNRRVYPREILGLLVGKAGMAREDIGVIHILDNYSFVQVRDSTAEETIRVLNGITFRGRTLAVNYAKNKKDRSEEDNEETETSVETADSLQESDNGDDKEDI